MQILDELLYEAPRFLALDQEHWNSDEGFFRFHSLEVFYTKNDEAIILEVDGTELEIEHYDAVLELL